MNNIFQISDLKNKRILLIGIFLCIFYWFFDTWLDFFIFRKNNTFFLALFPIEIHELWMRLFAVIFILIFSILANYFYITDKKIKLQLEQSKQQFKNIYDISPIGIVIIQDNQIKYVNQTALNYIGYTREEIKRENLKDLLKIIHPEDRDIIDEQLKKKKSEKPDQELNYQFRAIKKNGNIIWLDNYSKTIEFNGKPADLIVYIDITGRKQAEKKVEESEKKYRELFNNIISGLAIYRAVNGGQDFKIVDINLFGQKIENVKKEKVIGKKVSEVFSAIREFGLFDVFQRVWKTGKPEHHPAHFYDDEKVKGWRENYVYKLPSGEIVAVYDDVTTEKEHEQFLKASYEKINFYKDLLSHNMGNVLNNINASLQLLEKWDEDFQKSEKKSEVMNILREQVKLGSSLISDVRKLPSMEKERGKVDSLNVKDLIHSAINRTSKFFRGKNIEIEKIFPSDQLRVKGTKLLTKAFEKILMNSVIHNNSDPIRIWIEVKKVRIENDTLVRIEFKDNGIGISDDRKKMIFDKDYKIANRKGGLGIGLSLVREIINEYGGQIWVEDRISGQTSRGANFIVLLKKKS